MIRIYNKIKSKLIRVADPWLPLQLSDNDLNPPNVMALSFAAHLAISHSFVRIVGLVLSCYFTPFVFFFQSDKHIAIGITSRDQQVMRINPSNPDMARDNHRTGNPYVDPCQLNSRQYQVCTLRSGRPHRCQNLSLPLYTSFALL